MYTFKSEKELENIIRIDKSIPNKVIENAKYHIGLVEESYEEAPQYAHERAALRGGLILRIRTLHGFMHIQFCKNREIRRASPYPIGQKNVQFFPQKHVADPSKRGEAGVRGRFKTDRTDNRTVHTNP